MEPFEVAESAGDVTALQAEVADLKAQLVGTTLERDALSQALRKMSDKAMALEGGLAEEREGRLTDLKELVLAALGAE